MQLTFSHVPDVAAAVVVVAEHTCVPSDVEADDHAGRDGRRAAVADRLLRRRPRPPSHEKNGPACAVRSPTGLPSASPGTFWRKLFRPAVDQLAAHWLVFGIVPSSLMFVTA